MKSLVVILALFSSSVSYAALTCYKADAKISENLPTEFCFEAVGVYDDGGSQRLEFIGGNLNGEYAIDMKYNRDRTTSISMQETILNIPGHGCMASETAILTIKGEMDEDSALQHKELDIRVEYAYSKDSCHLEPQSSVLIYHGPDQRSY